MNRATKLTLTAALPVAALAIAWQSNPAAASSVEPPNPAPAGAFPPPSGDVPAGWATLIDDTGSISISVPSTWTAVDLTPADYPAGSQDPWISATTDQGLFLVSDPAADTYSVPGVIVRAYPRVSVTAEMLETSGYSELCTPGPVQSYDDGEYVGFIRSFDRCGGTGSRIVELVANPRIGSATMYVGVQLTGLPDDEATLNGLLSSFSNLGAVDAITSVVSDPPTPVEAPTAAPGDNPLGVLEQQLHDELGLEITDEQAICLANTTANLDPSVIVAAADDLFGMSADVLLALLNCGINVFAVPAG